jgi:hypothetical protein
MASFLQIINKKPQTNISPDSGLLPEYENSKFQNIIEMIGPEAMDTYDLISGISLFLRFA